MRKHKLHCFIFILFAWTTRYSAAAKDIVILGETTVQFVGKSGKLRVYDTKEPDEYIEVNFDELEEIAAPGEKKSKNKVNLGNKDFEWTDPQNVTVDGYRAQKISSQSDLNGQGSFSVAAFVFETDAQVCHGDTIYEIPKGFVKFSVKVGNWQWETPNNTLQMGITYRSSVKNNKTDVLINKPDGSEAYMNLGRAVLSVAKRAIVDGQEAPIDIALKITGQKRNIDLIFPHFTDGVDYDPNLGLPQPDPPGVINACSIQHVRVLTILICALLQLLSQRLL